MMLEVVTQKLESDAIAAIALVAAPSNYWSAGRAEAGKTLMEGWEAGHPRVHTAVKKGRAGYVSRMRNLAERRLFFAPRIQRVNKNISVFRGLKFGDKADRIVEECGPPSAIVKSDSRITDIYLYVGSANTLRFHAIDGFLVDAVCYATKYSHEQPPTGYTP